VRGSMVWSQTLEFSHVLHGGLLTSQLP